MNNKDFQPNWRSLRLIFATLLLTLSTYTGLMAQETLCERLAIIPINSNTIDLNTNTNTLPNHIFNNTKMAQGRLVLVANLVTVTNQVVTFEDCDIRMANDAGFRVPAGTTLIFRGCRIAAFNCDQLWDKINVDGGRLIMENNNVEDAKIAIWSKKGGSRITAGGNIFNRNHTCISLTAQQTTKPSIYNIKYNTYKQSGKPVNPDPNGGNFQLGIELFNIKGINLTGKFENLHSGIIAKNSELTVGGATFLNINHFKSRKTREDFIKLLIRDGIGIRSTYSNVNVSGSFFTNCSFAGIAGDESSLKCEGSEFISVNTFGIIMPTCRDVDRVKIKSNKFYMEDNLYANSFIDFETLAIGLGDEIISNNFYINGKNNITSLNKGFQGIYFNGKTINSCKIVDNVFEGISPKTNPLNLIPYGVYAIFNYGGNKNEVLRNQIKVSNNFTANGTYGINISSENEFCLVKDNFIDSELEIAINVVNAKNTNICTNEMKNSFTSLYMNGDCLDSKIFHNKFSNNTSLGFSMYFETSDIGVKLQKHHGNQFLTGHGQALHDGLDYQSSRFFINDIAGSNCVDNTFMPSSVEPSDWFNSEENCTKSCSFTSLANNGDDDISVLDADIMGNRLSLYNYTAAQTWNANFNLYKRIIANPALTNNSSVNTYFNMINNSNFAKFYNIENRVNLIMRDEAFTNQVNLLTTQKNIALDILMAALQLCINDDENIELENAYEQAYIQFNVAAAALETYVQNHNLNRNALLEAVLNQNELIETSSIVEANLKTTNKLRIKNYMDIDLSEAEWDIAKQIAQICTKDGGKPTSIARCLVSKRTFIQDNCSGTHGKIATNINKPINAIFYPNPATSELNINYKTSNANNSEVMLKIYDLSGKLVINKSLNLNDFSTINISELNEGFYLINLYEANRLVVADKFVKSN